MIHDEVPHPAPLLLKLSVVRCFMSCLWVMPRQKRCTSWPVAAAAALAHTALIHRCIVAAQAQAAAYGYGGYQPVPPVRPALMMPSLPSSSTPVRPFGADGAFSGFIQPQQVSCVYGAKLPRTHHV